MILLLAIRAYQRFWLVNTAVRLGVRLHHLIFRPQTRPCPYAAQGCSEHFATEAKARGVTVLPSILATMAVCGPSVSSDDCTGGDMGILDKKDCGQVSACMPPSDRLSLGGPCGGPKGPPKSFEGDGC